MLARDDSNDITGRFRCEALDAVATTGQREEGVLTMLTGPSPGFVYTLDAPSLTFGRSADADVVIADRGLSRIHARITREPRGFVFEDMLSTNGSYIQGQRVAKPQRLEDGQRISMGINTLLRFSLHDAVEQNAARMTRDLTMRDPLTRLYNRRHLNDRLMSEVAYARRHDVALTVLLVDIDRFKRVNDEHGHVVGDRVLRELADTLHTIVRTEDVLARYGGEEFVIIARAIDEYGANSLGERVRAAVAGMRVQGASGLFGITASVGTAHAKKGQVAEAMPLLETADQALYRAKNEGRNRVVMQFPRPTARRSGVVPRKGE
ncbi:MAG: GGDEF domain-containing protein [Myxococcales bacterium]|nr:GGDEF domain-containing protein [Myxococcales bacterium]